MLDPLLSLLTLKEWNGILWSDLRMRGARDEYPDVPDNADAAIARPMNGTMYYARLLRSGAHGPASVLERDTWSAMAAWLTWGVTSAHERNVPREAQADWPLLWTYPGDPWQIPQVWVDTARGARITWREWKLYATLGHVGAVPLNASTMRACIDLQLQIGADALRSLAAGRDLPTPRGSGSVDLPPRWATALDKATASMTAESRRVYRSCIRRIITEAGGTDPAKCGIVAARIGGATRSAWNKLHHEITGEYPASRGQHRTGHGLVPHERAHEFDRQEAKAMRDAAGVGRVSFDEDEGG